MRFRRLRQRNVAPLTVGGRPMSGREYQAWRDAHAWDPSRATELVICADLAAARWIEPLLYATRSYYLLRGPLSAYGDFPDSPSYWWPDDRAWCVCTDTDFEWAYLAGPADCVAEVIASPVIDALATKPDNPAVSGMDVINDPDGSVPRSF